jgi:hypothetical protein
MHNLCQQDYKWHNENVDEILITEMFGPVALWEGEATLITYEREVFERMRAETGNFYNVIKCTAKTLENKTVNVDIHIKGVQTMESRGDERFILRVEFYAPSAPSNRTKENS